MTEDIFTNYATLLKNPSTYKDPSYEIKYFKHFFLKHLPIDKNAAMLDVGCGSGKYLKILNTLGYNNVYGIDISKEQIALAKEQGLLNTEIIDPLKFLKTKQNSYKTILLMDVLEHVPLNYSFQLIDTIYDSLQKDSNLIVQVPNAFALFSPHRYSDITHLRAYCVYSLQQTFNLSKFNNLIFQELYPFSHGIKSFIRKNLWFFLIKPIIKAFLLIAYGKTFENIYSANILCIAKKN